MQNENRIWQNRKKKKLLSGKKGTR